MPTRKPLPQRRRADTFELHWGKLNSKFQVTVGHYSFTEFSPGEVFISGAKAGSEIDAIARDGSVLLSLALQYGTPIDVIAKTLTREGDGSPSTVIGGVVDLLVKNGSAT